MKMTMMGLNFVLRLPFSAQPQPPPESVRLPHRYGILHPTSTAATSTLCYVTSSVPSAPERDDEPFSNTLYRPGICTESVAFHKFNFFNLRMCVLCNVPHSPYHNIHPPTRDPYPFSSITSKVPLFLLLRPQTPTHGQALRTYTHARECCYCIASTLHASTP